MRVLSRAPNFPSDPLLRAIARHQKYPHQNIYVYEWTILFRFNLSDRRLNLTGYAERSVENPMGYNLFNHNYHWLRKEELFVRRKKKKKNENNDRIVRDTMSSGRINSRGSRARVLFASIHERGRRAISKTSIHCLKMYGTSIRARCAFVSRRHFRRNIETRFANSCENR